MFLKQALLLCSELQQDIASKYEALCDESPADARIQAWQVCAARERRRAGYLDALAQLCTALGDEGPFLVQIPVQLGELRRALDSAEWRRDTCASHPGCSCAETLDRVAGAELYADLMELAEPHLRRTLRLIAEEIRTVRRAADAGAVRREVRAAACA